MADIPPVRYASTSDGARIAYMQWSGEAPPFLALYTPGSMPISVKAGIKEELGDYTTWWDGFRGGRSWTMFDYRGTGASSPITGELSNQQMEWDVEAVAEALGKPVDVVSVGRSCFPLFTLAHRRPELFRSLWVVPIGVRFDMSLEAQNRPGWDLDYRDHLRKMLLTFTSDAARADRTARFWEDGVPQESFAAYLRAAEHVDLSEILPEIRIPTWVNARTGAESGPAGEVAALLPNATLSVAPRGGVHTEFTRDDWEANLGHRLTSDVAQRHVPSLPDPLTDRECQILALIATGMSTPTIAADLTLSTRTVEAHIQNIYTKLNVHNRVEAANWARDHGVA